MSVDEFLNQQPADRHAIMRELHMAIMNNDKNVEPVIGPMMGKEMIIYKERCYMKYALSSVKKHMSVHCMPIYMNPALYNRYVELMPEAKFQKGCFNFNSAGEVPIQVAIQLFSDCAKISIAEMLEKRNKK